MESLAGLNDPSATIERVMPEIDGWYDLPGDLLDIGTTSDDTNPEFIGDVIRYLCALHPNSLSSEQVRIYIEAKILDEDPLLQVIFGAGADVHPFPSLPIPLGDDWYAYSFTFVRTNPGEPLGKLLDMFVLEQRNVQIRVFEARDLGSKGDVNLNGSVDADDLNIVMQNMHQTGHLELEQGDTNLDGVIDGADALNVIYGINE